jgi:hypothetical protein
MESQSRKLFYYTQNIAEMREKGRETVNNYDEINNNVREE